MDRPADGQAVADALTAYLNRVQERLHQAELAEAEAKTKATAFALAPPCDLRHGLRTMDACGQRLSG